MFYSLKSVIRQTQIIGITIITEEDDTFVN